METNNNEVLEQNNMENENVVNTPNEVAQNENVENNNFNNKMEKSDKNNLKILVGIFVAFAIVCLVGVFAMSAFKSDEQKFFELLIKKQSVAKFSDELVEKAQKNEQVNSSLEVDVAEIVEEFGGDLGTDLKIGLNLSQIIKKDDMSGSLEIVLNKNSLGSIEFAKTGEIYGAKLDETTEKFIAIENKDLQKMFEKFEVEGAELMPDKILTQKDFEEVMKLKPSKVNKIADKYIDVLAKSAKDKVEVEKNVELKIGDEKIKTKKYTLTLNQKQFSEMMLAVLGELKDDRKNMELVIDDMKAIVKLMEDTGYPVEDMYGFSYKDIPDTDELCDELQKALQEAYDDMKEDLEDIDFDEDEVIHLIVYEYKGEAVATEFAADDASIIFKCLANKDVHISFGMEEDKEEIMAIILEGTNDKNELKLDMKISSEMENIDLKLFTIKQEYKKKAEKDMVKLDKKTALILNDATMDEVEEFGLELMEGVQEFAEDKATELEDVLAPFASMQESVIEPDYNYDYDYDYDDFDYNYNYDDFDYNVEQKTGLLQEAQIMYNKINMNDTKAQLIQKLGEPDDISVYSTSEYLVWDLKSQPDIEAIEVHIFDGEISSKEIMIYSSEYDGILLGKELGAQVEDLETAILKVKEGMTLTEVKAILGNSCFESEKNSYGDTDYTWYDKQEQSVSISFDKNGKVWYIGFVW